MSNYQNKTFWYKKQNVTALTEPDNSGRICIQDSDYNLKLVPLIDLQLPLTEQFRCYWSGKDRDVFTIRKTKIIDGRVELMTIPKDLLPEIMSIMKQTKASRSSPFLCEEKDVAEGTNQETEEG